MVGVALFLLGIMKERWDTSKPRELPFPSKAFTIGGTVVTTTQVLRWRSPSPSSCSSPSSCRRPRPARRCGRSPTTASVGGLLGVPVRRVEAVAWLGSGSTVRLRLHAAAVVLKSLDQGTLTWFVIAALAGAIVGQFRSLWITFFASIIIGVLESVFTPFNENLAGPGRLPQHRPGRRVGRAPSSGSAASAPSCSQGGRCDERPRSAQLTGAIVGSNRSSRSRSCVLRLLPDPCALRATSGSANFTQMAMFAVVAASAGMLYGRVGLVSLGQVAPYGIGCWVTHAADVRDDLPFLVTVLIGGLGAAIIGVLIGLPALRVSGLYLALVTLMLAAGVEIVLVQFELPERRLGFKGVATTLSDITPLPRPSFAESPTRAYLRYRRGVLAGPVHARLRTSCPGSPGRAWASITQSEAAALTAGIDVTRYKLLAFALASFMAGCRRRSVRRHRAEARWASSSSTASRRCFLIAVVIMGGIHSLWGGVLACVLRDVPAQVPDVVRARILDPARSPVLDTTSPCRCSVSVC